MLPSLIAEYEHSNQIIYNRLSLNEVSKVIKDKAYLDKLKDGLGNKSYVDPEDPISSICSVSVCITENGNGDNGRTFLLGRTDVKGTVQGRGKCTD